MTAPTYGPFDASRIENLVTLCLGAIVTSAASFAPAIELPSRQIAGVGLIPYDCEQVLASMQSLTTGIPESTGFYTGANTWPPFDAGANNTMYQATLTLAIVRNSKEVITGVGNNPPPASAYLANLGMVSADMAVLLAAVSQIADAQHSAVPQTELPGGPLGGLVASVCRITVLC